MKIKIERKPTGWFIWLENSVAIFGDRIQEVQATRQLQATLQVFYGDHLVAIINQSDNEIVWKEFKNDILWNILCRLNRS